MVILDVTVINVAVPVIDRELSASLTGIQWITDGYTLVLAGFLLTGGALGDRLGNRRVFCAGVAVFTVASAACALAPNASFLVGARLVEGLGAALIVPGSLALLQQAYPGAAARSRAFGLWGSMAGIAACAGPLLGGLLVSTVGWRRVFLVNLPVGAACLVLTLRHVARSPRRADRALDWPAQLRGRGGGGAADRRARRGRTARLVRSGGARRGGPDRPVRGGVRGARAAGPVPRASAEPAALTRDERRRRHRPAVQLRFLRHGVHGQPGLPAPPRLQRPRHRAGTVPGAGDDHVRLRAVRTAERPHRRPSAGGLRHAPGRPGAGRLGRGGDRLRLRGAGGPDDGRGVRYLLRPHRFDRHRDGCRAPGVLGGSPRPCFNTTRQVGSAPVWPSAAACSPRPPTSAPGCAPAWPSARSPSWLPRCSRGSACRAGPKGRRAVWISGPVSPRRRPGWCSAACLPRRAGSYRPGRRSPGSAGRAR